MASERANKKRGVFIVFEGAEGGGKTTQARLLFEWLKSLGVDAVLTREPGSVLGGALRELLLSLSSNITKRGELLLFEADRTEHVYTVIRPALEQGKIVICDRYEAGTYAYQHYARGACDHREFFIINDYATGGLRPDLTFWIDIPMEVGLERNRQVGKDDRFEREGLRFHERVHAGFKTYFTKLYPDAVRIDGQMHTDKIHDEVSKYVRKLI